MPHVPVCLLPCLSPQGLRLTWIRKGCCTALQLAKIGLLLCPQIWLGESYRCIERILQTGHCCCNGWSLGSEGPGSIIPLQSRGGRLDCWTGAGVAATQIEFLTPNKTWVQFCMVWLINFNFMRNSEFTDNSRSCLTSMHLRRVQNKDCSQDLSTH